MSFQLCVCVWFAGIAPACVVATGGADVVATVFAAVVAATTAAVAAEDAFPAPAAMCWYTQKVLVS